MPLVSFLAVPFASPAQSNAIVADFADVPSHGSEIIPPSSKNDRIEPDESSSDDGRRPHDVVVESLDTPVAA